jgi:RNA polymerase sigma-70 factor (ECF subfamily)
MRADSDIQLMLDFKDGNALAFQKLFNKYKKQVMNYCFRFCGNLAVAEELAQETFLRMYRAASRYQPKARFTTWLFKIATNVCLNELRKPDYSQKVQSVSLDDPAGDSAIADADQFGADADYELNETQRIIHRAIMKLPEKQRAALMLRIEGEFSYKEIAKQMFCSENHVKILIFRARQQLKELLNIS